MPILNMRTRWGDRTIEIHRGAEEDANAIFGSTEYDIRKIWFAEVQNVVDVGGHVGLFSIFVKNVFPSAKVTCFEPLPINLPLLHDNLNGYENVSIRDYGLSSYEHVTEIWLSPASGHGAASTFRTRDHIEEKQLVRFAVAAQELAVIEGPIAILKIDTEGHELRILRNVAPHFDRIQSIFLEVHSSLALANIILLLNDKFVPFHFGAGMGNRYKVMFASRMAMSADIVRAQIAPDIYYD